MRVGIIALLHESNTFLKRKTVLQDFSNDLLLLAESVREQLAGADHEVGGFFAGLEEAGIEAVPIFAARAYPSGVIEAATFRELEKRMLTALAEAGSLDGVLAAPHGATVAENHADADGRWLSQVRKAIGERAPLIATIDPHANLSQQMVSATNAIVAYRTNPHLDQKETGKRAARLMSQTLRREVQPMQAASFPPLAINIQSQNTGKQPLQHVYAAAAKICDQPNVLSQSIVLGFPYADVAELGSSAVVVTDNNPDLAQQLADEIGDMIWRKRDAFEPEFTRVEKAIECVANAENRTLLLDMGDNVGGGSPADSTVILHELERRRITPSFVCLYDPESVHAAAKIGAGNSVTLALGGKTDLQHGEPLSSKCRVLSLSDGRFSEAETRHGGFQNFDQGRTAIVQTTAGVTVMLTSRRMPPFSARQLTSCELDPRKFRVLVAKGVIAPLAAYGRFCDQVIHVNTPGVTCADMTQLPFQNRRRPLFPFEQSF